MDEQLRQFRQAAEAVFAALAAQARVGDVITFPPGTELHARGVRRGVVVCTDLTIPQVFERWAGKYGQPPQWWAAQFKEHPVMAPGWEARKWPVIRVDPQPGRAWALEEFWLGPVLNPVEPAAPADRN